MVIQRLSANIFRYPNLLCENISQEMAHKIVLLIGKIKTVLLPSGNINIGANRVSIKGSWYDSLLKKLHAILYFTFKWTSLNLSNSEVLVELPL